MNPEHRVILRPASCGNGRVGARLPPPAEDWLLRYRYDVPDYPTAGFLPTEVRTL